MTIKYIRHSGFIVEEGTCALMIDCCGVTKKSPELSRLVDKRLYILASHVHGDHFDPKIMSFDAAKWILSDDIHGKIPNCEDIYFLAKGDVYRDDSVTIKAYGSTDVGVSFYIETGGFRIFHAGDLNNWHWNEEETPGDAAKNEQAFLDELALIAQENPVLDAVMFPVDSRLGKDYTCGAEQFLDKIKVGLFIPMHFWKDSKAARAFKPESEKRGCRFAEIREVGDVFEVEKIS
jgi:L-ascorbate metabolism protein UlaG (beta-lactamase superfamily)